MLLHQRHQLGAKAASAGRFMHDHTAAGFFHRVDDGFQVKRPQAAQVDDFGIDAGLFGGYLRHVYGGAVGQDGHVLARPGNGSQVQRYGVIAIRNLGGRVLGPRRNRAVVVTVERAVVQTLGLQEDHRVIVFDGGDQQALGIIGV
ncbi:hypothetical protein D3C76_813450 [compost metagenome]